MVEYEVDFEDLDEVEIERRREEVMPGGSK